MGAGDVAMLAMLPFILAPFLFFVLPWMGIPLPGFWTFGYGKPKIVCLGDNLTFGTGAHLRFTDGKGFPELSGRGNYTAKLANILKNRFKILNFAFPNATVIEIPKKDGTMYCTTPEFTAAIKSEPNIVVIMLGTVDTAPSNWKYAGFVSSTFRQQLHTLVENFMNEYSVQLVVLCHPPVLVKADIVAGGRGGLKEEDSATKSRKVDIRDCVKQVCVDIDSVIQIKQKLGSSASGWAKKKIVSVDMHELLVIQQRQKQQDKQDALATQPRAVKRKAEQSAKKDKKQGKLTQSEALSTAQQIFHATKVVSSGVGLTPMGANLVAQKLASVIMQNFGAKKKVKQAAGDLHSDLHSDLQKID